jgi:hypothetical protein
MTTSDVESGSETGGKTGGETDGETNGVSADCSHGKLQLRKTAVTALRYTDSSSTVPTLRQIPQKPCRPLLGTASSWARLKNHLADTPLSGSLSSKMQYPESKRVSSTSNPHRAGHAQ